MAKSRESLNLILSSKAHAFSVASLISVPMDEHDEESLHQYAYPSVSPSSESGRKPGFT